MSNWFADKLGPDPRLATGAKPTASKKQPLQTTKQAPPQPAMRQQAPQAKAQPTPPPVDDKKKKKGWF